MREIDQLKIEARQLLEEVNNQFERSTGRCNSGSVYNAESLCGSSFNSRLRQLKKKVATLQLTPGSLANYYGALFSR